MKILSVDLCAVSPWISVKQNYTEIHGEDTENHGEKNHLTICE
jgi:hypothetical protein